MILFKSLSFDYIIYVKERIGMKDRNIHEIFNVWTLVFIIIDLCKVLYLNISILKFLVDDITDHPISDASSQTFLLQEAMKEVCKYY